MYFYSDDPAMDLIRHQAANPPRRARKECCNECGSHLGDFCYEVDLQYMCEDCFDDAFKVELNNDVVCDDCRHIIDGDTAYKLDGVYFCEKCAKDIYRCHTPEIDD